MFLTVIPLGVYYFGTKVRARKSLWSESEFEGDRFAYHGTGKELLIGFLKAVLMFSLPLFLLGLAQALLAPTPVLHIALTLLLYSAILLLIPYAIVGARRYRLSRTSWRDIRFAFRRRALEFITLFVGGSLLSSITLGLYYPFLRMLIEAGMDPAGMIAFLQAPPWADTKGAALSGYLSTRPQTPARVERLKSLAAQSQVRPVTLLPDDEWRGIRKICQGLGPPS